MLEHNDQIRHINVSGPAGKIFYKVKTKIPKAHNFSNLSNSTL